MERQSAFHFCLIFFLAFFTLFFFFGQERSHGEVFDKSRSVYTGIKDSPSGFRELLLVLSSLAGSKAFAV